MNQFGTGPAPAQPPSSFQNLKLEESSRWKKWAIIGAIAVLLALSGFLYYQNVQAQAKLKKLGNPQQASKEEAQSLIKKVGAIVALPGDEEPTVATVVDASKLKSQPFFANAQNGDKVLLYTKAKKAYLYRPTSNKLIEVATLNINKETQTQTPAPAKR
ncbi:MAG TPA: hypothetical protein VNA68_03205 [Candidatus Dormibacteraeota bacterium]|nr:hypothetical protein [Candidatus Dormibacteraeota bacterium]